MGQRQTGKELQEIPRERESGRGGDILTQREREGGGGRREGERDRDRDRETEKDRERRTHIHTHNGGTHTSSLRGKKRPADRAPSLPLALSICRHHSMMASAHWPRGKASASKARDTTIDSHHPGLPRWPSGYGVRLQSGRSRVRIPLAPRFSRSRVIPVT